MKLSILIPITPERYDTVQPLLDLLGCEGTNGICVEMDDYEHWTTIYTIKDYEVILMSDCKEATLGEKREWLYQAAKGEYSFMVDSDDLIAEDAIELILAAIDQKPDCITFREKCMINGVYQSSNHSLKYDKWQDNFDGFSYVRTPFYKDVIKTEIARSVPFPHIRYSEDFEWAKLLKPYLKSEVHIDEELYYYIYNSQPEESHEKRYGIV